MNYITEQLCFLRYLRSHKLSSGEVALWYALFASSNNAGGLGKEFCVSDSMLRIYSGLGQTRLAEARKALVAKGLLICSEYQKRELRQYRLMSMEQLMNQGEEPQIFLPDSESESNTESIGDTKSENKSDSKSVSKSVTYINKKEKEEQEQKQEEKREAHGTFQNIFLTKKERQDLSANVPDADGLIRRMSLYLKSTGKQYQNHYAALLKWAEEDKKQGFTVKSEEDEIAALEQAIADERVRRYKEELLQFTG